MKRSQSDPETIAGAVIEDLSLSGRRLAFWNAAQWMAYQDGRYMRRTQSEVDHHYLIPSLRGVVADEWAKKKWSMPPFNTKLIADVRLCIQALATLPESTMLNTWLKGSAPPPPGTLATLSVNNGLLFIQPSTTRLITHTPDWFSTVQLPTRYSPEAGHTRWSQFLADVMEDDPERTAILQEWFGYCLLPGLHLQRLLVLYGSGGNGKSVLQETLTRLLGTDNCSAVPLQDFAGRFSLHQTLGKMVNTASEVKIPKSAEDSIKMFTSGEQMTFEQKHQPAFSAYPTAKLIASTNALPRLEDVGESMRRRLIILPFLKTIPRQRQDPNLIEALTSELPGILNWAIEGAQRLSRHQAFTDSTVCATYHDALFQESNPAIQFQHTFYRVEPGARIAKRAVYEHYVYWCHEEGHEPLNEAAFGRQVFKAFPKIRDVRGVRNGGRTTEYVGITAICMTAENTLHDPQRSVEGSDALDDSHTSATDHNTHMMDCPFDDDIDVIEDPFFSTL